MIFSPVELEKIIHLIEEKVEELEKQLNIEKDIELFGVCHHEIEDYREILNKMGKKLESKY